MQKIKQKLIQFLHGRYGGDALNLALLVLYLVLALLHTLLRWPLFLLLMAVDLTWSLYRSFSRNYTARRRENAAFLRMLSPVKNALLLLRNRIRDFRTHVYHKCPHCKAMLRLPRKKGKHSVRCPRCGDSFAMRVYIGGNEK